MIEGQIVDTTTKYGRLFHKFQKKIEREKKKYPISEREQIFVDTIEELIKLLDTTSRNL